MKNNSKCPFPFFTPKERTTSIIGGNKTVDVVLVHAVDFVRVDDDSGDSLNAKISTQLLPDRDYYAQIQTFDPKGGKFEFSITSW